MPFYRCQIESPLTSEAVLLRVRGMVREAPGLIQSIEESYGSLTESAPPFMGSVDGATFSMRRDIRYHNSFLPRVRGSVVSSPGGGATVFLTMHLHPAVFVFMLFWHVPVGFVAFLVLKSPQSSFRTVCIPVGMFFFGIVLTVTGFYPEAVKARRLLEQGLENTTHQ